MAALAADVRADHRERPRAVVGGLLPDLAGPRGVRDGAVATVSPGRRRPPTCPRPIGRAAPTCTSTRSPPTGPRASTRSSTTSTGGADLDVIAITDHERIDAALAARAMAARPRPALEVVVGEEVTTRGGHLLALCTSRRRSARTLAAPTIAAVHDAGRHRDPGPPARPVPAVRPGLRRSAGCSPTRTRAFRPDALETFNPTTLGRPRHARVVRFADEFGLPHVGNSDAHALDAIGHGWTTFPGRTAADLRRRSSRGQTEHHGSFHGTAGQLGDVRAAAAQARPRRPRRAGRPAPPRRHRPRPRLPGRATPRPPRFDAGRPGDEDRPRLPVRLPAAGRRHPARPVPLREPAAARPRRPDHHQQPRPAALSEGDVIRIGVGFSMPTNGSVGTITVSPRYSARSATCSSASSSTCSTSTSRSCRSCRCSCCASRPA